MRRAQDVLIKVDKAPGFVNLASNNSPSLEQVGVKQELTYDENKSSNCHVDKIINELETELRKISPDGDKLNPSELVKATMVLNNKIRKRGLTVSEIHFSRDSHDNSNLHLCDKDLQNHHQEIRIQNREHGTNSNKSKSAPIP